MIHQTLIAKGYTEINNLFEKHLKYCTITIFPTSDGNKVIRRISSPAGQVVDMRRMSIEEIETDQLFMSIIADENRPVVITAPKQPQPQSQPAAIKLPERDNGPIIKLKG